MLLVASVIIALVLVEIVLRIADFSYPSFYRPDDRLGLRLRENTEGWFTSEGEAFVRINTAGFRDKERSLAKSPGAVRIAVLGDSMIEALQVDLEKTFVSMLEQRLNACGAFGGRTVEVMNFGVSGYGTAQQLLTYRHYASGYAPDLVLVAVFAGNDIRNNSRDLEPEKVRPFFVLNGDKLVEDGSFAQSEEFRRRTNLLRAVLERLRPFRVIQAAYLIKDRVHYQPSGPQTPIAGGGDEAGLDDAVYSEPTTTQWRDAWTLTERLLVQLRDDVRASGANLIVVSLSSGIQVHPDPGARADFVRAKGIKDIFYPNRRVEKVASQAGVSSILLGPRFQEVAEQEKVFLHGFANTRLGTGHWNEAGNRLAADIVAKELCTNAPAHARGK